MKKLALVSALALAGFTSQALASDGGTITFHGELTAQTCFISLNGSGSADGTVTLLTVPVGELANDPVAGSTEFTVTLSGEDCTFGKAAVSFGQDNVNTNHRLDNTAADGDLDNPKADNVELAIHDKNNNEQILIGVDGHHNDSWQNFENNKAELTYFVRYVTTGPVKPGLITSELAYTIKYQ